MNVKRITTGLVGALLAVGGLVAVDAAPAHAATTCQAASYRPGGGTVFGGTTASGYIACTARIYQHEITVQVQKWNGSSWVNWPTPANTGWCSYWYQSCSMGVSAAPASAGLYRTKTSGWVKATAGSAWFPVAARYSATTSF
jgi:hypothetical protein